MKRRTFISLISVMAAAGVLTLAGCSNSSDSTAASGTAASVAPAASDQLSSIQSSGKLIVAIMSAGHFTSSGHFIVLRGVKDEKILVADPASRTRSEQGWELSIILNEASKAAGSGGPFWIIG